MTNGEEKATLPPEIEEGKTMAAIGYISILFLIPLLAKKENKFCQFHGKQGAVLFGVEVIGAVVLAILSAILGLVPCAGWAISLVLWLAFCVCALGLSIWGFIQALKGEYWDMPVIAPLAQKLNF
ncbi:MAG: DUF4870 domain-containing protein [Candidatus Zixiibacteriota bacterium]|jgi:uncharacterized membrane protein